MGLEIERKFLLKNNFWKAHTESKFQIVQGYLNTQKERTVRVRIYGDQGFLTIKGESKGITRLEFEYSIPKEDAVELLTLCKGPLIEKYRYLIKRGELIWEVDEFYGDNEGLILAEVELKEENQQFDFPDWLGKEVSKDQRYFNASLVNNPFKLWKDNV